MVSTDAGCCGALADGASAPGTCADETIWITAPRTSPNPGPPRARTEKDPASKEGKGALADHNPRRGTRPAV